jgi:MinD-like ATPase involved in chromosome partitioning or flagellar assembly
MDELSDANLRRLYDNLQKEQFNMMNTLKNTDDDKKSKYVQKQISTINNVNLNIIKFINLRKQFDNQQKNI